LILLLFTSSYPYDYAAEYTFIQPEIRHLVEKFERIVLVPRVCKGKMFPLPPSVEVTDQYANFLRDNSGPRKMIEMAFSSQVFFREIRKRPAILPYLSKVLKLILYSGRAELTRQWVTNWIRTQHINTSNCILYSYWFDHTATGLAMTKQESPGAKVVSRAHGYDIYEEYYYPYYWPYRRETLDVLDALLFASDAGKNYFCEHYPEYVSKFETAHLGIEDPEFVAKPSSDRIFRMVSCSHIVPVKRLELLLDGIETSAHLRPEQKFEWIHFGDGRARKSLSRRITRNFPANAQGRLVGYMPNHEIVRYYKDHPVDVFVNVSSTEGGAPVAIQEAISCGIPIVATSVGGNPEIVSEKNGVLLRSDPKPHEIATALLKIWDDTLLAAKMRTGSRQVWQASYNADVNFRAFAERLKSIGES